ncbi:hypothetical protein [Streptomyces narbonensis]|uniref:hypothetical protein n=1 Tax=Streptomyces narbonensis TaxID=67333 RepID=UPI00340A97A4
MSGRNYEGFSAWVREMALEVGYALDIPMSGAITDLSEAIGTADYNVSRVLKAQRIPSYRAWPAWASALGVSDELFREKAKAAICGR